MNTKNKLTYIALEICDEEPLLKEYGNCNEKGDESKSRYRTNRNVLNGDENPNKALKYINLGVYSSIVVFMLYSILVLR